MIARFPVLVSENKTTTSITVSTRRNPKFIEIENAPNFLCLLSNQFNALNKNVSEKEMVEYVTRTIVETVDQFAPERLYTKIVIKTQQITNKPKMLYNKKTISSKTE